MPIRHNKTTHRWVIETARWATAGQSLPQAALRLVLCCLPVPERWRAVRGHLKIVAVQSPNE